MVDVTAATKNKVSLLEKPLRLVIDIPNAQLTKPLSQPSVQHTLFTNIKTSQQKDNLRIVAELKKPVTSKAYLLQPNKMYGHRLVVDLFERSAEKIQVSAADLKASNAIINQIVGTPRSTVKQSTVVAKTEHVANKKPSDLPRQSQSENNPVLAKSKKSIDGGKNRRIVVAIDAGHGGQDPGAHGANGTEEKKVVFAIAKKLEKLINKQPGMKAVMIRKGDYYVDLRNRMKIARAAKADLFISIHADAFQDADVRGASVFTLSNKGASSEAARWLANSENAADLVGGVSLGDKDDVLATVLLDLTQTATQEASVHVARKVLDNFENIGELHLKSVQKAGFLVLKSPDIPSILVETAFISNPSEEFKLVNPAHQFEVANAIFNGVRSYFNQVSPEISRVAELDVK